VSNPARTRMPPEDLLPGLAGYIKSPLLVHLKEVKENAVSSHKALSEFESMAVVLRTDEPRY
jgi:hypothetical protein